MVAAADLLFVLRIRSHAHEATNGYIGILRKRGDNLRQFVGQEARLSLLAGYVHLQQDVLHQSLLSGLVVEGAQQLLGVHRLDEVRSQPQQVADLVGLQVSDEVPTDIRGQNSHFLLQFLHPTLPEIAFAGLVGLSYRLRRMELTDTHQGYTGWHARANISYAFCDCSHSTYGAIYRVFFSS